MSEQTHTVPLSYLGFKGGAYYVYRDGHPTPSFAMDPEFMKNITDICIAHCDIPDDLLHLFHTPMKKEVDVLSKSTGPQEIVATKKRQLEMSSESTEPQELVTTKKRELDMSSESTGPQKIVATKKERAGDVI